MNSYICKEGTDVCGIAPVQTVSQNHAAEDEGDDPDDIERLDKPKKRGVQSSQSSEPAPRKGKGRLLGHAKKGKTVRTKEDDWLDDMSEGEGGQGLQQSDSDSEESGSDDWSEDSDNSGDDVIVSVP